MRETALLCVVLTAAAFTGCGGGGTGGVTASPSSATTGGTTGGGTTGGGTTGGTTAGTTGGTTTTTTGGTTGATTPPLIDLSCASDVVTGLSTTGQLDVGPADDFVPLCSGQVLIGDKKTNQIRLLDLAAGTAPQSFQLNSAPGDMAADAADDLLFVTQASASNIVKIDLASGTPSQIALTGPATWLAVGNGGRLFATVGGGLSVIDGTAGKVLATTTPYPGFDPLIVFDGPANELVTGSVGLSPSSLTRYSFDPATLQLTQVQQLWNAGSNGQDLAISPDDGHIAYPCGGGNLGGYTVTDFKSTDLNTTFGDWNTGAYPRSAAFSPDGKLVAATDGTVLQVFDATTHAILQSYPLDFTGCGYQEVSKVRFSRGGKIAYAYTSCGFNSDAGRIFWRVLP